jgi:hypothetical protein
MTCANTRQATNQKLYRGICRRVSMRWREPPESLSLTLAATGRIAGQNFVFGNVKGRLCRGCFHHGNV